MDKTEINFKAFYFSPHFWWTSFDRAVYLTDAFGAELITDFEFKNWLKEGIVEHETTSINLGPDFGLNKEYGEAIKNDYFYEVVGTNKYGHKVKARTIDELHAKYEINDKIPVSYNFKIDDLNQFVSMYFYQWLLFDTYYDWVRWQLYFDFILSKLDGLHKELYLYMWTVIFNQVEFQHTLFKDVAQYKKFRDKLEDIQKSESIEDRIAKLRQTQNA